MHHPGTPSFCSSDSLPRLAGQSSISSVATPVSSAILSSADVKFSRLGPHQIDLPSKTNLAGAYHHRCMFIRPPSSLQDAPELPEDTKGLPMNLLVFQHLHRSPTAIGSNAVADQGHRRLLYSSEEYPTDPNPRFKRTSTVHCDLIQRLRMLLH
ncbi:hypothetical protein VPH35_020765 [Triticum aestivum]